MADPVKISELPAISSVQPNDIIPIVDSALTQTSKCTASQIAAIGGGPPGDGTVTTGKIASGAVTYPKIQNVTGDRVLGKTSGASGTVEEIPCTSFARSLLAAADGNAARALINDTPTFTGTVTVNGTTNLNGNVTIAGQARAADGTVSAPGYSFADNLNTGIASLQQNTVSVVAGGVEMLRVEATGQISAVIPNTSTRYPFSGVRVWLVFNMVNGAIIAASNVSSATRFAQGYFQINYATALPDVGYAIGGSASVYTPQAPNGMPLYLTEQNRGTSYAQMLVTDGYNDKMDAYWASFFVIR